MLQFEDSYFKGETRDGFYIEPMMKRCWAAQLEILSDIDAVCKKHNITYFADWGSLLGAVRHHGFIPWDDDLDIAMRREDFEKFKEVAEKELPDNYSLYNMHTDVENIEFINRVVNSRVICLEEDFLKKYHGFPYSTGIDIFPIDYFPAEKSEEELLGSILELVAMASNAVVDESLEPEVVEALLAGVEKICNITLDRTLDGLHMRNHLVRLVEQLFMAYDKEDAVEMTSACNYYIKKWNYRLPKSSYESVIWMPFETIEIPVPAGYDMILRTNYGDDYMTPRPGGGSHDYPFYKEQREILRNWMRDNRIPDGQYEI